MDSKNNNNDAFKLENLFGVKDKVALITGGGSGKFLSSRESSRLGLGMGVSESVPTAVHCGMRARLTTSAVSRHATHPNCRTTLQSTDFYQASV